MRAYYYKGKRAPEVRMFNSGSECRSKVFSDMVGLKSIPNHCLPLMRRIEVQVRNVQANAKQRRVPVIELFYFNPHRAFYEVSSIPNVTVDGSVSKLMTLYKRMQLQADTSFDSVRKVAEWERDLTQDQCSVNDVAEETGLTVSDVKRRFMQTLGLTPRVYFGQLKMYDAAAEILVSKKKIEEIAIGLGFQDMSAFHLQFAAQFGMGPVAYKERYADRVSPAL